jgi:hypothetical protein
LIQENLFAAHLPNAARNAVSMVRTHGFERLHDHRV